MAETEKKKFKDWFDADAVRLLGEQLASAQPGFDRKQFQQRATRDLESLELSARIVRISEAIVATLPDDRNQALQTLIDSLPPVLPDCEAVTDGWLQWPLGHAIGLLGRENVEAAFEAMIELTQRFSSEFAIRPFLEADPEGVCARLQSLTGHPSPHVRRWCSEGIRPRLPWGGHQKALIRDPSPIWPVLEDLKADPERYVRRSVANNLNDIAKDHPDTVLERCETWWGQSEATDSLIRHGLRTLVKQGNPRALRLLGFHPPEHLKVELTLDPDTVAIGGFTTLTLRLTHRGSRPQPVLIDYGVSYVRTRGRNEKVFKWTQRTLKPGGSLTLTKRHPMKPTTVRALYPGKHVVRIQVNGTAVATASFLLAESP